MQHWTRPSRDGDEADIPQNFAEYPIPYGKAQGAGLETLVPSAVVLACVLSHRLLHSPLTDLLVSCSIQAGRDGMIYAAAGIKSQFLRINPTTMNITVFTPPYPNSIAGNLEFFNDMYAAPDGVSLHILHQSWRAR